MRALLTSLLCLTGFPALAAAQTTGTVFGPDVDADEREFSYRVAAEYEDAGGEAGFAHRIHYQQAINGALRWRALASWSDPAGGDFEFDHVQGELVWQLVERTPAGYSTALRFDARLAEEAPHEIGVNWTNQWIIAEGWRARGLVLFDRDVGDGANEDWILETRASLYRSLGNGLSLGVESFNEFGGLDAGFGGFDDQSHQIGPVLSGDLIKGVEWSAGVLFGLSDGAADQDVMLRLSRDL